MCYNWRTNAGFYDVWHRFLPDIHQDQTVQNFISARPAWPGSRCTRKQERIGHDDGLHTVLASDIMLYILPFSSQNTSFAVQLKKKKRKKKIQQMAAVTCAVRNPFPPSLLNALQWCLVYSALFRDVLKSLCRLLCFSPEGCRSSVTLLQHY